jgi:hypothetical protein
MVSDQGRRSSVEGVHVVVRRRRHVSRDERFAEYNTSEFYNDRQLVAGVGEEVSMKGANHVMKEDQKSENVEYPAHLFLYFSRSLWSSWGFPGPILDTGDPVLRKQTLLPSWTS